MRTTPDLRHPISHVARSPRAGLAALAVGALLLGACSGTDGPAEADAAEPTTTAASPSAADEATPEPTEAPDPVSLGEPGPVTAGETVETPNLGGLRFVVPEDRFLHQSPGLVIVEQQGLPGEIILVSVVETMEGEPIEEVDTVVELVDEVTVALDEAEPTTIAGHEARVFDFTAEPDRKPRVADAVLRFLDDCDCGWGPVGEGRMWLLDTPRGILLFDANAPQDGLLADPAEVIAEAETIFATLELVDGGA